MFGIALKDAESVFEGAKACIAPNFADSAENADSAELFENVRVAQKNAFKGGWATGGKMRPDDFDDGWNFFVGKTESLKQAGRFFERVSDVVPFSKRGWIFGAMANEDAQVVEPRGSIKDFVIERLILRELFCELVKARLVAEFVGRVGLGADVIGDGGAVIGVGHERKLR